MQRSEIYVRADLAKKLPELTSDVAAANVKAKEVAHDQTVGGGMQTFASWTSAIGSLAMAGGLFWLMATDSADRRAPGYTFVAGLALEVLALPFAIAGAIIVPSRSDIEEVLNEYNARVAAPYRSSDLSLVEPPPDRIVHSKSQGPKYELGMMLAAKRTGLIITGVLSRTGAARAGVQEGDVLVSIEGQPVRTIEDVAKCLAGRTSKDIVVMEVRRQDAVLAIEVLLAGNLPRETPVEGAE